MSARPARAASDGTSGDWLVSPVEQGPKFSLEGDIGRIEHLSAGNDDDVESTWRFVPTKQLAGKPLGAVPYDGWPQFPGRRNTKARGHRPIRSDEEGHEAA